MNVLDLQNLGVEEMNEMEVRDVDGGILGMLACGVAAYFLYDCLMNPSDAGAAFMEGARSKF